MKGSELMIGDYVIAETINKPIRIAAIHKYKVGYHSHDTTIAWVGRGLISPIPLTHDILVNNGWVYGEEDGIAFYKGILTFEPCSKNEFEWRVRRDFDFIDATNSTPIRIRYVHELQHLLKLVNLQKDIII